MLETKVSEILENILGYLALEGSFEVEEGEEFINVSIDTHDAGKLIGRGGETLSALQLLVNQILSRQLKDETAFKKVVVDVSNWRKSKEEELAERATEWGEEVKETGEEIALEPMPAWQRRIVHMTIEEMEGVYSESEGQGIDRHLVVKPGTAPESAAAE